MGIPGTQLQIFNNPEFGAVRRIEIDGKLYVVGIDVARALEYANPSKAILDHCKGVSKLGIPSEGGIQETNIIPIGDIYRLIVKAADQSKNPEIRTKAERFEKWIFDEVIPIVVETGKYEASPAFQDEHLRMMDKLIKENDASIMGKGDRAAFFRLLGNLAKASGGVSSRNQKLLLRPGENYLPSSEISPGDMLIKLLRHAEPMLTFQPRYAGTGSDNIWLRPGETERGYTFTLEEAAKYADEPIQLQPTLFSKEEIESCQASKITK